MSFCLKQEKFKDTKVVIEVIYQRRTDHTMTKKKTTKGQNNDLQNTTQNTRDPIMRHTGVTRGGSRIWD